MTKGPRLIARIALYSALIYVLSWATAYLPNINLAFFIAFAAGYSWGLLPGLAVGAIGEGLWTGLNPLGPAVLPIALAQIIGMAACGLVGAVWRGRGGNRSPVHGWPSLVAAALFCTLVFYLPVSIVDAWVFQPFWPRLIGGLPFVLISLGANAVIFPLLFRVTARINERERRTV